ncbi:MAG: zinc-dependent alcohol dehydrogenase family protein [Verrucomicrobiae bacterium]|nr:zinc-dependent alcohol dehydrogenase family protein [Verrucomicrobiae bacterium]
MKAIVIDGFGGPEVFKQVELPRPELKPGHVLLRVVATSVNPVDYKIRSGLLAAVAPESGILGGDVAGVVEEVAEDVTGFSPGDEVFGCIGGVIGCPGALAEYVVADADLLALKPSNLSLEQAAALPLVSITAWDGLFDKARLDGKSAPTVLVYGGTGGVGHIALQLARQAGCKVHATASSDAKLKIVRDLGADVAINYREMDAAAMVAAHTGGNGYDLVFDSVGGDNVVKCFDAAGLNSTVVSINTRCTADLAPMHQKALSLHVVFMLIPLASGKGRARHGEILRELTALVESGSVRPLIHDQRFAIPDIGAAHTLLQEGGATGKIVLIW